MQQQDQVPVDQRQMMAGQIQRNSGPTDKGQSLERLAAMRRASVEGVSALQGQNLQSFQHHHNQGQVMQRMPLSPQSLGPLRGEPPQQAGHHMPPTLPASPGQKGSSGAFSPQLMTRAPQPAPAGSPQSALTRSPLPPPRPVQPNMPRPSQTPAPFMQRPLSPAEPSSYRPTAAYRQPAPPFPQQQSMRPAPPAYSGRHTSLSSYPPLAPKPTPGVNVPFSQDSQVRKQIPSNNVSGSYQSTQQVPRSPLQRGEPTRQNFQPVPNTPPSPLLATSTGQRFTSQPNIPDGLRGRNIRPSMGHDSRQASRESLPG